MLRSVGIVGLLRLVIASGLSVATIQTAAISTALAQQPAVTQLTTRIVSFSQFKSIYDRLSPEQQDLVNRARALTADIDDLPCWRIHREGIYEKAEATLRELKSLMLQASFFGADDVSALFDYVGGDLDDALYWFEEDCGPPGGLLGGRITINLSGGPSQIKLPAQAYLGINNGVSDSLGLYKTPRYADGASFSGSIKYDMKSIVSPLFEFGGAGSTTTPWAKVSAFYASLRLEDTPGTISPGAGNRMLFPGPQGGASGVSLGGFPANTVTNAMYTADFNKIGGRIDLGQTTKTRSGLAIDFYGGAVLGHSAYAQYFTGQVPGFNRIYDYNTSIDVNFFKLRAGLNLMHDIPLSNGATLSLGAGFELGPDFSSANGTDSFFFTGVQGSSANLDASRTALGYGVTLSAGLKLQKDFSVGMSFGYMRETGLPVVTRDGTNPSRVTLEDGDKFDFRLKANWDFSNIPPIDPRLLR